MQISKYQLLYDFTMSEKKRDNLFTNTEDDQGIFSEVTPGGKLQCTSGVAPTHRAETRFQYDANDGNRSLLSYDITIPISHLINGTLSASVTKLTYELIDIPFTDAYCRENRPGCSWKIRIDFKTKIPYILWTISDDYIATDDKIEKLYPCLRRYNILGYRFRSYRGLKYWCDFNTVTLTNTDGEQVFTFESKTNEFKTITSYGTMDDKPTRFKISAKISNCEMSKREIIDIIRKNDITFMVTGDKIVIN